MPRPPSIQFYYKQYLGDNKVLAMDWDARGMHIHLLMLSIQENPPGTIPADDAAIRRWLSLPLGSVDSDQTWRRVKSQLLAAWQPEGERLVNSGMREACLRQEKYRNRYEIGTKNEGDSMPPVSEETKDFSKSQKPSLRPEVFLPEHDKALDGFDSSALGIGLLGKIGIPSTRNYIAAAGSSIDLAAKQFGWSVAGATDWLLSKAKEEMARGGKVDIFWFQDGVQRWTKFDAAPISTGNCSKHPDSGLTSTGACWGCYQSKFGKESA